MTHQAFQVLLTHLFRAAGARQTRRRPDSGHFRCAGVDTAVFFDENIDQSKLRVYLDFGTVAPHRQRDVYRTLLMSNRDLGPARGAILGLDPHTGRVVLFATIAFNEQLSGDRLASILHRFVRQSARWRVRPSEKAWGRAVHSKRAARRQTS